MKRVVICVLIFFIFGISSLYLIKNLEDKNIKLIKKINFLEKKESGYKDKLISYGNGYLLIEADFFRNYEGNLLKFRKYLKEINKDCDNEKICINLTELDISFLKSIDIEKFLNYFSLKSVYKLRISSININKEGIIAIFKNLNYKKLRILHLDIDKVHGENLIGYIKNFINDKKDINLLETLIIENIGKDKLDNSDILDLVSLKVEKVEFLSYPINLNEILNILQNSEYLNKITITDGISYNSKKVFYFIKRNGKIYIYDNLGKKIN